VVDPYLPVLVRCVRGMVCTQLVRRWNRFGCRCPIFRRSAGAVQVRLCSGVLALWWTHHSSSAKSTMVERPLESAFPLWRASEADSFTAVTIPSSHHGRRQDGKIMIVGLAWLEIHATTRSANPGRIHSDCSCRVWAGEVDKALRLVLTLARHAVVRALSQRSTMHGSSNVA
jgi:hypothetical protein